VVQATNAVPANDDDSDDEELGEDIPEPSSPFYKAKVEKWQRDLAKADQDGKKRKIAYYRRLLTMYPPFPLGHDILRKYIEALEYEYKEGNAEMVTLWIEGLDEAKFTEAGTTKETFDKWQDTSERLVKDGDISIGELKQAWGVNKKKTTMPEQKEETSGSAYTPPSTPAPPAPQPGMPQPQQQQAGQMPWMQKQPSMKMANNFGQFGQGHAMMGAFTTMQTTYQQTIIQQPAQPAVQKMAATVPWGMYGGMYMQVETPHGRMKVQIPPGYGPGSSFTFNVPVRTY